ncbi:MAG: hypothetical protein R3B54_04035 [Bdellovibrionota bacterium]
MRTLSNILFHLLRQPVCRLAAVILLWVSPRTFALNEFLDLYDAPQVLAQGNAMTADAYGYLSNYYNPAGLAKMPSRKSEIHLVALEGSSSGTGAARAVEARSWGVGPLNPKVASNPGSYTYFSYGAIPAISVRGFSLSLLARREYAALSDGTNVDIDTRTDLGVTLGVAKNFAGNLVKLGVVGKAILRNQLKGTYAHSDFYSEQAIQALAKEGLGLGADVGLIITLPYKYLPTFGLVWKDVLGTQFSSSQFLNSYSTSAPDTIPQSFNFGFSVSPRFSRLWRMKFAADIRHIERTDLPFRKKLHLGFEMESLKGLRGTYWWLGLNQLDPCFGMGVRLPGGNLEIGTYGMEIGAGETAESDRRFFMRYTVSF